MDEIQTRLQETSKACLDAYSTWVDNKKDSKAQENLNSSIHELRKVSSRLEIELAVSERDQVTSKPLPIPSHRSNSKGRKAQSDHQNLPDNDDGGKAKVPEIKQRRRRTPPKKADNGDD